MGKKPSASRAPRRRELYRGKHSQILAGVLGPGMEGLGRAPSICVASMRQRKTGGIAAQGGASNKCAALPRQLSAAETRQRCGKLPCNFVPPHTVQHHPPVSRHHTSQSLPLISLYNAVAVKYRLPVPGFVIYKQHRESNGKVTGINDEPVPHIAFSCTHRLLAG